MNKYDSTINQKRLNILSNNIMERFDEIQECLNIHLEKDKKFYVGACPIHQGDRFNALNIYHTGDIVGNWQCRSKHCENTFVGSAIGFVRGVLSQQKYNWSQPGDKMVSFKETLKFIEDCLKEDYSKIEIDFEEIEQTRFVQYANLYSKNSTVKKHQFTTNKFLTRNEIRGRKYNSLLIPAQYFINRGFNANILDKYDVGLCDDPRSDLYDRVVVPIYDNNHKYIIGNTSRSVYEKCDICKTWHNPKNDCPKPHETYKHSKWKHSYGFKKEENLYNYWFAKDHIQKTGVVVLTESPGNVWKFEEAGIVTSLATYGASLTDGQKYLLNQTGAFTIIIVMDNDQAGLQCTKDIMKMCQNTYQTYTFTPPLNDVGDMTVEEIHKTFLPLYNKCVQERIL